MDKGGIVSIRDRIAWAIHEALQEGPPPGTFLNNHVADAVLAACPEIAALDHAREGFVAAPAHPEQVMLDDYWPDATPMARVLVIPKPESS
jgi:hypothetical protein